MALLRRAQNRLNSNIWPGFVDAMTALLLILFFVLSIFMIVQFVLRETINVQDKQLDSLSVQINSLASALGLERQNVAQLQDDLTTAQGVERGLRATIFSLRGDLRDSENRLIAANNRITGFEAQIAGLLADKAGLESARADLQLENLRVIDEKEALELALASARLEVNAREQAARLAAAKREAMQALIDELRVGDADLSLEVGELESELDSKTAELSEVERARLLENRAAEILRERLKNAEDELTTMTLILEEKRAEAERTLTLLAAAELSQERLETLLSDEDAAVFSDQQRQAALLARARDLLAQEREVSADGQRRLALLNQQTLALRQQLNSLQQLLDASRAADADADVQIETLGADLNAALARVAAEQRARADLEQRERERLTEETADLRKYRSDFFGRLRVVLEGQTGVRIVGDRFVFSSEVLFDVGSSVLGEQGRAEIRKVAEVLQKVAADIPPEIDWILRVDGHTDMQPIREGSRFRDNWELSQARALSVVRYMIAPLGIPPNRLAANGFGEFQPIDSADSAEAYAVNRRIELKFTEK